jgi:hypothetical protein
MFQSKSSYAQKSNPAWDELCSLTTALVPKYGSRPIAFQAACQSNPALAAVAIDPNGAAVVRNSGKSVAMADPAEESWGKAKPWSEVIASHNAKDQTPSGGDNHGWKKAVSAFNAGVRR